MVTKTLCIYIAYRLLLIACYCLELDPDRMAATVLLVCNPCCSQKLLRGAVAYGDPREGQRCCHNANDPDTSCIIDVAVFD